jgi:soluble lytic murein transglycosylase-like protein
MSQPNVTGLIPRVYMWLPILMALLSSALTLLWLLSRPSILSEGQAYPHAAVGVQAEPQQQTQSPLADSGLSPIFTAEVQRWRSDILRWSDTYNLDPNLVATVMQIESCGHPSVISSSGAIGLFQVMPFHFLPNEDPFDPETNATRGLEYLARGISLSEGINDLALAGYNGGHGVIGLDFPQWPSETQRYVTWGRGILDDIASGVSQSPSLQAWLQAGGERLCRSASRVTVSRTSAITP